MPFSLARPSRLKKLPGILPAAYMRSSTSTVRGKKSASANLGGATVPVASTVVSPVDATTAPDAWPAILPVSNLNTLSPIFRSTVFASGGIALLLLFGRTSRRSARRFKGEAPGFRADSQLEVHPSISGERRDVHLWMGLRLITDRRRPSPVPD